MGNAPSTLGTACAGTRVPTEASVRTARDNHHLWRNGRLWWIAFTIRQSDGTHRRVRRSLRTDDVGLARWRRDRVLAGYGAIAGCEVVISDLRCAS